MIYYEVLVEHASMQINQTFTYAYSQEIPCGVRVRIPFGRQNLVGLVMSRLEDKPEVHFQIRVIAEVIDSEPLLNEELQKLAGYISERTLSSLMSVYKTMLPSAYKPSSKAASTVFEDWIVPVNEEKAAEIRQNSSVRKLTPKQQEILEGIPEPVLAVQARRRFSAAVLRTLIQKGWLYIEKRPKSYALTQMQGTDSWPDLRPGQQQALDQIHASTNPLILLHGVTGSGKTEVFFRLAQEQLEAGRQVLILVPEIGLTPMMIERIQRRFSCELIIYHSRLSSAEAADQYRKARNMKTGIVLGTRSACFLPMDNLGLIIMDEEHDSSYKQDSMPKYHARDVAAFRSSYHHCQLIMASATPCLESYARAVKHVYTLVTMSKRAAGNLPDIRLVDMRIERSYGGLSYPLIKAIEKRLANNEQVILLLNRRGYIPVAMCTSCKKTVDCEDCGIPLSYHKEEGALVCHICGRRYPVHYECPHCHQHSWSDLGLGTQKLEERLLDLFPQARTVRMDADTTRGKYGHSHVLETFEKQGDILLGTQMVAKGLDYERVTLTGIISADQELSRADYRAAEMSYQMLEQACGRSGRGSLPGQVLIQTYSPEHYVLQYIVQHDYRGFFVREMAYRHLGWYPPYLFMASLVIHHADLDTAYRLAQRARAFLETEQAFVLGPMEITMRKKIHRVRLLIKEKDHRKLSSLLWRYTGWHQTALRNVQYEINMDPVVLEE